MIRALNVVLVSALWAHLTITEGYSNVDKVQMIILHTNDIHSRILQSDKNGRECDERKRQKGECYGGVARIHNAVRRIKNVTRNALFLNAGDFYQGTIWYSVLKDEIVSAAMSKMMYDVLCLGNHEFDDGPDGLAPFLWKMSASGVPVLGTNLDCSEEPLFKNITLPKSKVLWISGQRVAFLGVVTTETLTIARPGAIRILPEVESINNETAVLKRQGINIFILISHVGFDVDKKIAEACPDLGLIVGGHTNTFLYTGTPPVDDKVEGPYPYVHKRSDNSTCLIVQAYRFGKYLGFLNLEIDSKGRVSKWSGNPILLSQAVPEDPDIVDYLRPYKKKVEEAVRKPVGSTKVLLEADDKVCRYKECNSANLMADAFLDYYANRNSSVPGAWSIVNAAVINGGSAKSSIPQKPNVLLGDLISTMPYDNELVLLNISGSDLLRMFEHGVAKFTWYPDLEGRFLQVSGMRVVYNFNFPSEHRVVSLKILCANCSVPEYEEVKAEKMYRIVTTAFIANGGDGFQFNETVTKHTEGISAFDVFEQYFIKMSPIKTPVEGRVVVRHLPRKENVRAARAHRSPRFRNLFPLITFN
uniref:Putative salivary ecto-5'-nucleotidase/apyrase n=1 Tax=Rhipicephalus pulchellus TaxID=72859 RepID=L7M8T9_RHIPC